MMKTIQWILSLMVCCNLASLTTPAATLYVWQDSPSPGSPYAGWATAAHSIQDALDAATAGDTVLVTNGVYAVGGKALDGLLTNRVAVDKSITLQSVNGPLFSFIQGYQLPGTTNGDGAIRCVYLTNRARLSGFTLTNGGTRSLGDETREQSGGGVLCESANAIVSDCVLNGNSANFRGGGAQGGWLTNCTLSRNSAGFAGGGASGSTLAHCALSTNSAFDGGAVDSCTLNDCALDGNSAYFGGGADLSTLSNCTLTGNSGGGAWGSILTNCTLTWNVKGGASFCTLKDCVLATNSAINGGGVYGGTLNDCALTGNSAATSGGGAYQATLIHCTLTGNSSRYGGGADQSRLSNCTIDGNRATSLGGGVEDSTLNQCTLTGNSAEGLGGGASGGTLNNCILTANSALDGGGAFGATLNNSTLTGNSAGNWGGGAYGGTFNNCILYYNTAPTGPNWFSLAPRITNNYCCTTPMPTNGVGNITNEPLFLDRLKGNLRLQSQSPCINAGDNSYATNDTDFDGRPRIVGGTVDMGAYEYQGAGMGEFIAWLQQYGLPTDGSADSVDSDRDGSSNYQEWQVDTNPTNAASLLSLRIDSNTPSVAIKLLSSAARLYTLQCCTNLILSSVWTPIPGQTEVPGNGAMLTLTDTNPPAPAFYRVSVRLP